MGSAIELLILLGTLWVLSFLRTPVRVWTITLGILLLVFTILREFSWAFLGALWFLYLLTAFIFNARNWRLAKLTPRLFKNFCKVVPNISQTEAEALEAGDVGWEGDLFNGSPNWNKLLALPKPQLSEEEQAFLDNEVETLCKMIADWEVVYDKELPDEVWDYIKTHGFLGLEIEKQYFGHGFSALAHSQIVTKIASRSASAAIMIMVPNSVGPAELIHRYGTIDQKEYYLPRLARGIDIPVFALTAPEAGSDAGSMKDHGVVCKGMFDGKEVLGIRLNWNKRYITLAPIATLIALAFKMYDPDHLLSEQEELGITVCLVPTQLPGVKVGNRHDPMGLAFLNGPTTGENVFLPLDFIIGGKENIGKGWRILMEALSVGRGISLPALATAAAKLSYRTTGAYAKIRKQFHLPIGQFEGVAEVMARIAGNTYICEATRLLTMAAVDLGQRPALASAITKYHLTELGRSIINDAMDIHAGRGIQMGPRNYLALMYQALPIGITVEGANILTRNLIIFGQGALRCHPYIRDEIACAQQAASPENLARFDQLLTSHIGFTLSNLSRSFAYGLTGGRWIKTPDAIDQKLRKYYQQLSRMSTALALSADLIMLSLGGELKRREQLSARLGDILSQLYLASAVLKYYHDHANEAEGDLSFATWTLEKCLYAIQTAFDELRDNLPRRWLGGLLHFLIFPWGNDYKPPRDKESQKLAQEMMHLSSFRDRLTQACYIGKNAQDPVGRVEIAFQQITLAEPLYNKLRNAIRSGQIKHHNSFSEQLKIAREAAIFSEDEINLLHNCERLLLDALQVDEFLPSTLVRKLNHASEQVELSS